MIKTKAIVLRTVDFKDNDRMLTLLTKDFGLMSARVRAAKKQTSKLFCSSSLFCCGDYEFYEKNGYYGVRGCRILHTFSRLGDDYDVYSVASFIADVSCRVAQEDYPAPKLFALVLNALYALDTGAASPDTVICYFIQRLLYIEGVYPGLEKCVICGSNDISFFSAEHGGVVCKNCSKSYGGESIDAKVLEVLRSITKVLPKDIGGLNLPKKSEGTLKQLLIAYIEHVLQSPLKTSKFVGGNKVK